MLALGDRVGAMSCAEHGVRDGFRLHARLLENLLQRLLDAGADVRRRARFGLGDELIFFVENDCVGVRAADVNSEPMLHGISSLLHRRRWADKERRNQSDAGRPARCPRVCAIFYGRAFRSP